MPALTTAFAQGLDAARPAATSSNAGYHYFSTDTQILWQSTGSAWVQIAAAGAGGVGAVADGGGASSLEVGTDSAKGAAGTAGRIYLADDTGNVYADNGVSWDTIATVQWANLTGKPSTFAPSAHESSHLAAGSDPLAGVAQTQIDVDATEAATNDSLSGGDLRTNLRRIRYQLAQLGTGAWNTLVAMVQLSPGSQQTGSINVSGEVQGSDFKPGGTTGATAAARYHAATTSGAPTSGTWQVGDIVPTQDGTFWICTGAGTPGTWTQVSGGGGSLSVTTKGDLQTYSTAADRLPVDADGKFLAADSSQSTGLDWKYPAGIAGVSTLSTALSADVTLTTQNTYYDGPTITVTPGTWLLMGEVTVVDAVAAAFMTGKLWDGSTVYDSQQTTTAAGAYTETMSLRAVVTPTATTTYKVSVANGTRNGGTIKAAAPNNSAGNNASSLSAIQLTGAPASGPGALMPAVRCYNSATQSIPNNTDTALTFDTNDFDQGTATAQHSTATNTSRLVCQQAGIYQISGLLGFEANSTGARFIYVRLNGATTIGYGTVFNPAPTSPYGAACVVSMVYHLNVGDYVELMANQSSGGALNAAAGDSSTAFMMARVDSGPGAVQPNTKVQLDYAASTDILSGTTLTTDTWIDAISNQTFTVDDANSVVEVAVSGYIVGGGSATLGELSSRIVIDSAGTAINKMVGGGSHSSSAYTNMLGGTNVISVTGLSVGSHTIKLQIRSNSASNGDSAYCRASTMPNTESLQIRVLERKQSSSLPSSMPAPAVRAYNSAAISVPHATGTALGFNTNRFDQGASTAQHSTSSNTSRLICQQAGTYQITGNVEWAASGTGIRDIRIVLNGSIIIGIDRKTGVAGVSLQQSVSTEYNLSVGDYVELVVYQESGGALNVNASGNFSPEFMMARIDSGPGHILLTTTQTANYSIPSVNTLTIVGAASKTMTLPTAAGVAGESCVVKNNASGTSTTVATTSSQTIDGASTYSLSSAWASATFVSDGSNWMVV